MNKYALIVIFTLGVIGIALFSYWRDSEHLVTDQNSTSVDNSTPNAGRGDVVQAPQSANVITYTDAGFTPSPLRVKKGTTVTFVNNSTGKMWPASAKHPTHTEYPTTGGCIGSTFDACGGMMPGESWTFTFDIPGSWNYHNHLSPQDFGTIIVE